MRQEEKEARDTIFTARQNSGCPVPQVSWDTLLQAFNPELEPVLFERMDRFTADGVVLFENVCLDSSSLGAQTCLVYGAHCTWKTPEETHGKWINDLPSRRMYPQCYALDPRNPKLLKAEDIQNPNTDDRTPDEIAHDDEVEWEELQDMDADEADKLERQDAILEQQEREDFEQSDEYFDPTGGNRL